MSVQLVADRYARALSAVVEDKSSLDGVLEALRRIVALYNNEEILRVALTNPSILHESRLRVLEAILERENVDQVSADFVRMVLRRRRIEVLGSIVDAFALLVDERLNRVEAKVTTALPLTEEQRAGVVSGLEAFTGKSARMIENIDDAIIGGVVVECEGKVMDGSLRARLDKIKEAVLA